MERVSNFIGKAITRATQRTVRFIRWLGLPPTAKDPSQTP